MRQSIAKKTKGFVRREPSAEERQKDAICAHNFGRMLRAFRVDVGRTQMDLAKAAGIDRAYLSDVERGVKSPTLRTLRAIARACGVRLCELIEFCGE